MRFIGRLPALAAGCGFTIGLVVIADSRDWSGWKLLLGAFIVGIFYVVTILVPSLLREQLALSPREVMHSTGNGQSQTTVVSIEVQTASGHVTSVHENAVRTGSSVTTVT